MCVCVCGCARREPRLAQSWNKETRASLSLLPCLLSWKNRKITVIAWQMDYRNDWINGWNEYSKREFHPRRALCCLLRTQSDRYGRQFYCFTDIGTGFVRLFYSARNIEASYGNNERKKKEKNATRPLTRFSVLNLIKIRSKVAYTRAKWNFGVQLFRHVWLSRSTFLKLNEDVWRDANGSNVRTILNHCRRESRKRNKLQLEF